LRGADVMENKKSASEDDEGKRAVRVSWVVLALLAVISGGCVSIQAMRRVEVTYDFVVAQAKELSLEKYRSPKLAPKRLRDLDYDDYRKISFDGRESLWAKEGLPFAIQFHHLGYLFDKEVQINEFTSTHSQTIRYLKQFFGYEDLDLSGALSSSLGYAGFRVMYPINGDDQEYQEIASFLGASYFRGIGKGAHYGASARGLAVDAGLSTPEEFPDFRTFWLGKPLGNSKSLTIYALLEGPSVVGAYEFVIHPDEEVVMDVQVRLFPRRDLHNVGLVPITSMFWRGENRSQRERDYRPEVHDSDGLLIAQNDGNWIWRPLDLAENTRLSYMDGRSIKGFGLFQRDTNFSSYQDLEAHYHQRPSVWIETVGDWGPGVTRLVELPTTTEFEDNIVAMWEPGSPLEAGKRYEFAYRIHWTRDSLPQGHPGIRAVDTRSGNDVARPELARMVVDFKDGREGPSNSTESPEIDASAHGFAELIESSVVWNEYAETWRVSLLLRPREGEWPVTELSCQLTMPDGTLSERWSYQWSR